MWVRENTFKKVSVNNSLFPSNQVPGFRLRQSQTLHSINSLMHNK